MSVVKVGIYIEREEWDGATTHYKYMRQHESCESPLAVKTCIVLAWEGAVRTGP